MVRKTFLIITLIFGIAILYGCGVNTDANTLIIATASDPVSLDLHATNDAASANISVQIYETLIYQNEDLQLEPGLATSWEYIGNNTFQFELKHDVYFHNGEPFTANDVAYTLTRALTSATIAHIVEPIDPNKIIIIDDYTIQIGTFEPFGPLLTHLAHPVTGILNQKAIEEGGANYGLTSAIGTGPFKFVSWVSGDRVILERNDEYHGNLANVSRVEFRIIRESGIRVIELETKAIDIAYDISPVDMNVVENDSSLTLIHTPNLAAEYLGINLRNNTPLQNVLVRQAIAHAIDVPAIINTIYAGVGEPMTGPINSLVFGYNDTLEPYQYDLELASELLNDAGYPNGGFSLSLYVGDTSIERIRVAQVVQQQLLQLGINVNIVQLEWASFLSATVNGDGDMFLLGWTTVTTDADYGLYPLFHSESSPSSGNRSFYSNSRVDELLDIGRTSIDNNIRLTAYFEAQQIIHEELPWVFLNTRENISAITNRISGFIQHPIGSHRLANVVKE